MTLIVGFHFGDYALVAADTRVSFFPPSGPAQRDDSRKIVRTGVGLPPRGRGGV